MVGLIHYPVHNDQVKSFDRVNNLDWIRGGTSSLVIDEPAMA